MKEPWKIFELHRFDRIMLQVSHNNEIVGTISLHENDMESRGLWKKAIGVMNESLQKDS